MNAKQIEDIAAAVLYEGYVLYPYRKSSVKNQQRWNFGVLYPRAYVEAQTGDDRWRSRTECLVQAGPSAKLNVQVRFLHLIRRDVENQPWQGAMERKVELELEMGSGGIRHWFLFEPEAGQELVQGRVEVSTDRLGAELFRIRADVINTSSMQVEAREEALFSSLVSAHSILTVQGGEFVSLLEPPQELQDAAQQCCNEGTWPVLVGERGTRKAMLSSPIILYDYPEIAPESPGSLFDGTEIDEILTLRIMTLTDEEKRQMGELDERTREILERTESMSPEHLMKLHGVLRQPR